MSYSVPVQRVIGVIGWLWNENDLVGRCMPQSDSPQGHAMRCIVVVDFGVNDILEVVGHLACWRWFAL